MAHELFAALWKQLQRHDLPNILREFVGQHTLDVSLLNPQDSGAADIQPLLRIVIWVKSFFDLQRAYLQGNGAHGDFDPLVLPYLLPSDLIYSTMMFLLQMKTRLLPTQNSANEDRVNVPLPILETILSGVRVILLRKEQLSNKQKQCLIHTIHLAWSTHSLSETDKCLVYDILPNGIAQIPTSDFAEVPMSPFDAPLPPWSSGLFSLDIRSSTFVQDAFGGLSMNDSNRLLAFWALYDALWAAESTIIRWHIGYRSGGRLQNSMEIIASLEQARDDLVGTIIATAMQSGSPNIVSTVEVLNSTLVVSRSEAGSSERPETRQNLLGMHPEVMKSLGDLLSWINARSIQIWNSNREFEVVSQNLKSSMRRWVESATVIQSSNQRYSIHEESEIYIVNCPALHPVPKGILQDALSGVDKLGYEEVYDDTPFVVLDAFCPLCPARPKIQYARMLEPLEEVADALRDRVEFDDSPSSYSAGQSTAPPEFSVIASQPGTLSRSTSPSSLRIDTTDSQGRHTPPILSPSITFDIPMTPISPETPRARAPNIDPRAMSKSHPTYESPKESKKPQSKLPSRGSGSIRMALSRKSTNKEKSQKSSTLLRQPRFAFSSKACSMILWGEDTPFIIRYNLNQSGDLVNRNLYNIKGVENAALGCNRCVAIATEGDQRRIFVFEGDTPHKNASIPINESLKMTPDLCMSVSRDDKFVALTLNDEVRVYCLGQGNIRRISLTGQSQGYQLPLLSLRRQNSNMETAGSLSKQALSWKDAEQETQRKYTVVERKLNFSADSKKLVIATHLADQQVYIDVWDCSSEPFTITTDFSRSFTLPPWSTNDGDLTNVFYDNLNRSAFLAAFLSKEHVNRIAIPGYDSPASEYFATKVVDAAQSAVGCRFTIANSMNEIHLLEYNTNGSLTHRRLKKAASKLSSGAWKPNQIALAMPNENTVLIFCIKDAKLLLRTVQVSDSEAIKDQDLRPEFDRAMRDINAGVDQQIADEEQSVSLSISTLPPGYDSTVVEMPVPGTDAVELPADSTPLELAATESPVASKSSWFS